MMKQMGGMMGLPGMRRKATKSPKNKRKGKSSRGGSRSWPVGQAGQGGLPAGLPGLDPGALEGGFKPPKLDFSKLTKRDRDGDR
jgi:signal recognition particle subunit SRP54